MHRNKAAHALIQLLLLTLLLQLSGCNRPAAQSRRFLEFGTLIDITLVAPSDTKTEDLFGRIEALLKQRHSDWHGWEDGSLSRFNQALQQDPTNNVEVPAILRELIEESKRYHELSDGRFNPALGRLIAAWGFHASQQPDHETISKIQRNIPRMTDLIVEGNRAHSLNPYLQLDFGGIAKGLAIAQISTLLRDAGIDNFIINAGGDVYAAGNRLGRAWRVAIQDPYVEDIIGAIELGDGESIFTSGNYRRAYRDPGKPLRHHIIDPVTGEPSRPMSSATVLVSDPVRADAAATTLMLTDTQQIPAVAADLELPGYMVISADRSIYVNRELHQRINWDTSYPINILGE